MSFSAWLLVDVGYGKFGKFFIGLYSFLGQRQPSHGSFKDVQGFLINANGNSQFSHL